MYFIEPENTGFLQTLSPDPVLREVLNQEESP